jgi:hypothetical protein
VKQKTPNKNTSSRKPLELSDFMIHLILDLRDKKHFADEYLSGKKLNGDV